MSFSRNPSLTLRRAIVAAALFAFAIVAGADPAEPIAMRMIRMPDGKRFGVIGAEAARPAPILLYPFSFKSMEKEPDYGDLAKRVLARGVVSIVLEEPGTGEDLRPGEDKANSLRVWRTRLDQGMDFTGAFNRYATAVIDYLIKEGYADPDRIAIWGCSRDGFISFHLAAADRRIKAVIGNSPVTDLLALREFIGTPRQKEAEALSLVHLAPALAGRAVWIDIGNNDRRVGADQAIAFARALARASAERKEEGAVIPVELLVGPSWHAGGFGHYAVKDFTRYEAEWLFQAFGL